MERRDGNTALNLTPESLAVTSVFLVLHGDPNEGYDPVGLYTSPELAAECVRELCKDMDNDPAQELKWGQIKVTEYAVENGAFVGGGELPPEELGF